MGVEREYLSDRPSALRDRKFIACGECGWVHYAMTVEEKLALDRGLARYNLTPTEQFTTNPLIGNAFVANRR